MNELKIIQTKDGSHSLLNENLNETYHSTHGAIQESLYVFIEKGLRFWLDKNKICEVSIFEVGFGTGLNALLTLQRSIEEEIKIRYTSIEAFPVELELVDQLNYAAQLNFESAESYFRQLHQAKWDAEISITSDFILEKRQGKMQELQFHSKNYDIIFFDAFAPSKQPEMWEKPMLEKIAAAMKDNSVFVTYCAMGQLKRDLKSIGLSVETLPGPPGKREMVRAVK